MECGYAICSAFLPGDRQVAVGTKSGEILIFDIASSSLFETIQAHTATVWSIHVRADGEALVSGSADKDVKFWEFEQKPADSENVGGWLSQLWRDTTLILCILAPQRTLTFARAYTDPEDDRRRAVCKI